MFKMRMVLGLLVSVVLVSSGCAQSNNVKSSGDVNLTWSASTDNVAVTGYNVYRNNVKIGTSTTTSYTDTTAVAGTAYSYTVTAVDAAGNESGKSTAAVVTPPPLADTTPPSVPSNLKATMAGGITPPSAVQVPGPSVALFNNPYYTCVRNFYVATNGSDSNDGTAAVTGGGHGPWLTIAKADTASRAGGDCINIGPGTYATFNAAIAHGGSRAAATGYVVYRCSTPAFISGTGCIITDPGRVICAGNNCGFNFPSYLMFDGFNFVASNRTQVLSYAISCGQVPTPSYSAGCHHLWMINNVIDGHGQSGIDIGDTEFLYAIHNTVTQNSHQTCQGYFGSGITFVVKRAVNGYVKTADDTNANNNPALTMMGLMPNAPFNNLVTWNIVGNNHNGPDINGCAGGTDGNGIISDITESTSCNSTSEPVNYPNQSLIAFNVVYNNGGVGIYLGSTAFTTVANNSVFNNNLDLSQNAWTRHNIGVQCGVASDGTGANTNLIINNIAVARPVDQASCNSPNWPQSVKPFNIGGSGSGNDWNKPGSVKNISFAVGTSCNTNNDPSGNGTYDNNPQWDCAANFCFTDPKWVNVGNSAGTMVVPPTNLNFALQPGSPAIGAGISTSYLPAQAVDIGACSHTLTTCP
jgi:parallel beta-helix repeat protein